MGFSKLHNHKFFSLNYLHLQPFWMSYIESLLHLIYVLLGEHLKKHKALYIEDLVYSQHRKSGLSGFIGFNSCPIVEWFGFQAIQNPDKLVRISNG
jgi:hypothetical protein